MEQKVCRICEEYKDNNLLKENLQKEIKTDDVKICRICKQKKSLSEFHIKRGTSDGHRNECKECIKEIQKKYKEAPDFKENRKKYDKERYNSLRDKILKRKKEYHVENREEILEKKKEYRSTEEYKINYKFWREQNKDRLAFLQSRYREKYPHVVAWRSVLYSTLKRLGTTKEGKTIEMLGYSALDLKYHIEKQFVEGMTWENHGEWHIDHIKAVATFDSDSDIREVCALDNLQPLWAFDNLSKNKY